MTATLQEWNEFTRSRSDIHLLQTGSWGELKSQFAWKPVRIICGEAGVQILFKNIPGGFTIGYIPKGPVGEASDELFHEIDKVCQTNRAVFLKMEPNEWEELGKAMDLKEKGWQPANTIQPRRTILLSLKDSEEAILAGMKQKTRYNIHLAEKKGISVKPSQDFRAFHKMMMVTGQRDGIGVHAQSYYQKAYDLFHEQGQCDLLFAYYEDIPIAAIMLFAVGNTAWYMYGASTESERNRMPTYLLQWEAIRWARQRGLEVYDLWGIPDVDENQLEEAFTRKHSHEGLWGVYRFKRGFGGKVVRSAGAWDRVYFPALYGIYMQIMKLRKRQED
jgi:lipid II:glycine glycyltransferase (peptidoglycan interpeptide bridge formation enzyme)